MNIDHLMEISDTIDVSQISTGNKNIILKGGGCQSLYYGVKFYCPATIKIDIMMQLMEKPGTYFIPEYFIIFIDLSYKLKKQLKQKNYNIIYQQFSTTAWPLILNDIIIENDLGIVIIEKKIAYSNANTDFLKRNMDIYFLNRRRFNKKI